MNASRLGTLVSVAALLALGAACGNSGDPTTGPPADTSTFCTDFGTAVQRCAYPAACVTELESVCPSQIEPSYSAAYMSALHACASTVGCDVDPGEDSCLFGKISAAAVTSAQSLIATDFCKACAPGSTLQSGAPDGLNCSGRAVTVPQGYGRVMGVDVLALSDSAAAAAESCVALAAADFSGDYDDCENSFLDCLADQQQDAWDVELDAACASVIDGG